VARNEWSFDEVDAGIEDYFSMLLDELNGVSHSKADTGEHLSEDYRIARGDR
jgi:hypothetical protein